MNVRRFHGNTARTADAYDDYYYPDDHSDDEKFDVKSFYGDAAGLDDDHDYYDHEDSNNSEFDSRKFYSVATGLDDVDSDHDDKEFSGM